MKKRPGTETGAQVGGQNGSGPFAGSARDPFSRPIRVDEIGRFGVALDKELPGME